MKTYDMVDWDFIIAILNIVELLTVFMGWIKQCIPTPTFSINLIGELVGFFQKLKRIEARGPYPPISLFYSYGGAFVPP